MRLGRTVYVTRELPEAVMAALSARLHVIPPAGSRPPTPDALLAGIREADAVICTLTERIDAGVLVQATRLRVVANYAVGYNNIDLEAARRHGVLVTNTPDILTEATADLTWALLLAVARRVPEGHRLVQDGAWAGWEACQLLGADVAGKTLGVVGMGRIGQAVARRSIGFKMSVLYTTRSGSTGQAAPLGTPVPLRDLLMGSDFVSLHVPLTPETHHLIGPSELGLMRPGAFLINTARGAVVDEEALADALEKGRLAGAALDVYEHEPQVHPALRRLTNVVTLPHLGSATLSTRIRMGMVCLENVLAVLEGREPPNRVA
ncbi:2-hydroxyacid dehydrogenase [Candidatus Nitrospira bockiana]